MKHRSSMLALVLGLAAVQGCGESAGPVAGVLTVNLVTPSGGSDGAILLTISGPAALISASPGAGLRVFHQGLGSTTHLALTGPLANGVILTIGVADIRKAAQYVVTVDEVAGQDYGVRPATGYSVTVSR